jgi:glutamate/tyrosine decarboxylase-like PLP-dependent enzyme
MDVSALDHELERMSKARDRLMAIVATAGTTDLGAIDPLVEIAERARRHGAWFHVDAAVAGAYLLSDHLARELAGIELADSVTIDFHKLWWQPFNASALIVQDEGSFDLLRVKSAYLDRGDEVEGMVNLVARSLDTSRRFDAAKVVVSLRTIGRQRLAKMLEHLVALTRYAGTVIESHPRLQLVVPPTSVMCVFDARDGTADDLRRVQQGLLLRGELILGRTVIKGRAALKFTFMNPLTTSQDVDRIVGLVASELDNI